MGVCDSKPETEWKRTGYKLSELDIVETDKYFIIYGPSSNNYFSNRKSIILDMIKKKRSCDINVMN